MLAPSHIAELAKQYGAEFGAGFVAYWVHGLFHRVWRAIARKPPHRH